MWWAHTKQPIKAIEAIAKIIPIEPNTGFKDILLTTWEIKPKPGKIKI